MNSGRFLDTNILVYAALQPDTRSERARALLAEGGTISVQVLNEFANVAARKLARPWPEIRAALASIRVLLNAPLPITAATHEAALDIALRYRFGFYDALIVAAALEGGCELLLSEDLQHGQIIDGRLTIHDPFRAE